MLMRRLLFAALILLAISIATPIAAQSSTRCVTPREACAFFDTYLAAFNQRDWTAFRATLADDITVMFDSPVLSERQDGILAVEKAFSRVFPPADRRPNKLPPPLQPENLLVQDLGDVVIVSFHLRAPKEVARRTVVMHRTAAGWRVVHIDASSFELPS